MLDLILPNYVFPVEESPEIVAVSGDGRVFYATLYDGVSTTRLVRYERSGGAWVYAAELYVEDATYGISAVSNRCSFDGSVIAVSLRDQADIFAVAPVLVFQDDALVQTIPASDFVDGRPGVLTLSGDGNVLVVRNSKATQAIRTYEGGPGSFAFVNTFNISSVDALRLLEGSTTLCMSRTTPSGLRVYTRAALGDAWVFSDVYTPEPPTRGLSEDGANYVDMDGVFNDRVDYYDGGFGTWGGSPSDVLVDRNDENSYSVFAADDRSFLILLGFADGVYTVYSYGTEPVEPVEPPTPDFWTRFDTTYEVP